MTKTEIGCVARLQNACHLTDDTYESNVLSYGLCSSGNGRVVLCRR